MARRTTNIDTDTGTTDSRIGTKTPCQQSIRSRLTRVLLDTNVVIGFLTMIVAITGSTFLIITNPGTTTTSAWNLISSTPVWMLIPAFTIVLVTHEAGHYAALKLQRIDIEETGIATIRSIPVSILVKPGTEFNTQTRRTKLRVYTAGITVNLAVAAIAVGTAAVIGNPSVVWTYLITDRHAPEAATSVVFLTCLAAVALINATVEFLPFPSTDGGKMVNELTKQAETKRELRHTGTSIGIDINEQRIVLSAGTALSVGVVLLLEYTSFIF